MARFNKKVTAKPVRNIAGGKAFKLDKGAGKEVELTHAVLTTFLEDKFYESGNDRLERIKTLCSQVGDVFLAKLAVFARKEAHMRSVSHALVGELAKSHSGDDLVKRAIVKVAERPDDCSEIAAYVGLPMPNQVKRGIRNAILQYSPYQLAKYKMEGKDFSMVDLFNLTHPKVKHASKEQKAAWKKLINGELKLEGETWESMSSAAESDEERTEGWETLIKENKLGYMALLRNLNNLLKSGVSDKTIKLAAKKLSDPDEVRKSKQLPFRFYTAFENVQGNRILSDAISEALDISVENVPAFDGKTLIAVDCSGSMSGGAIEKASIFAGALLKANKGADVVLYDTAIRPIALSGRTPVMDLADKIQNAATGGGTNTGLVFDHAAKVGKYDRIIILSDNESWSEGSYWGGNSGSVQARYEAYKKATGADPVVFAIDIQGYGTKDVAGKKVFHIAGWSEKIFDFMKFMERGDLVEYINSVEV